MRPILPTLVLLFFVGIACSSGSACDKPAAPLPPPTNGACGPKAFLYDDQSCPPPGAALLYDGGSAALVCSHEGDGLCHDRCVTDADCKDSCRPYCRVLGLFATYDWNCNVGVRICREQPVDDCNPKTVELR